MRVGLIATEFPPMSGGMAEFARGLASALALSDEVQVFTLAGSSPERKSLPIRDVLSGRLWVDAPVLHAAERDFDAWLALNASLIPVAAALDRPVFCYMHGNDFLDPWLACGPRWLEVIRRPYAGKIRRSLRRRAIRRDATALRHLLTNSRSTAAVACQSLGVGPDRISIVHPGVGDAFFQNQEPGDDKVLRLLTVSRLSRYTRRKNIDGVLRAIAQLGESLPIRYTIIGDGGDRPRLEALAEKLGLGKRVDFLGSVDLKRLLMAYRQSDLFVLASKATATDVEGFGIVYLEASASGVPVICSREGGATDAVVDGRNGLLIDRSTPEAIASGIERFRRERQRFRPASVRAFAEGFRWPKIAAQARTVLVEHLD